MTYFKTKGVFYFNLNFVQEEVSDILDTKWTQISEDMQLTKFERHI